MSFFASLSKGASAVTSASRTIHYGERWIAGSSDSRSEHIEAAIRLMAQKKINARDVIIDRISLADIHYGLDLRKNQQCFEVLVYPNGIKDET